MLYQNFQGIQLSALGLGCMRLPVIDGNDAAIDESATADMIAYAMENGINYYDTAWGYHSGNSETVVGKILSKYPRSSYYLASKFPGYDLVNIPHVQEIFEAQLQKCGVEYFDFYLFHNVCEMNIDAYLDETHGIYKYLMEQKANGRIRHLGFSAHGRLPVMRRFLEAYGADMEFCQIQLNWLDWTLQSAEEKVALLNEFQIPIWVMEPLRGGKLAALAPEHEAVLRSLRPEETIPAWSFRFLQSVPGVTMVLSGMSDFSQMQANVRTFETSAPLSEQEKESLFTIAQDMLRRTTVPCTACRYCTDHCPTGLDIPLLLELYNEHNFSGGGLRAPSVLETIPREKHPDACIACRSCEAVCPQQLRISEALADFVEKLHD